MTSKLDIGLVGAGQRGRSHVNTCYTVRDRDFLFSEREGDYPYNLYQRHATSVPSWAEDISDLRPRVTAIMDPTESERERTATICKENGDDPDLFQSIDEFVAAGEYNAVIISSPPDAHMDAILPLLDRDVDVLCEKGIVTDLGKYDEVIQAHRRSNALFYVGFNLRSSPFYVRLKELLDEGAIGDLGMISCQEARGPFHARYAYSQERGGGALLDKNSHDFDVFNWYVGSDPARVAAFGGQHVIDRDTDVMDYASVIVEYTDGTNGTLELCLYAPFGERTRLYELRGSDGLLRSPDEPQTIDLFTRDDRDRLSIDGGAGGHGGADLVQMKRFLRCLQGKQEPPATLIDAKKSAAVALGAQAAVAEGTVVEIDSNYDLQY